MATELCRPRIDGELSGRRRNNLIFYLLRIIDIVYDFQLFQISSSRVHHSAATLDWPLHMRPLQGRHPSPDQDTSDMRTSRTTRHFNVDKSSLMGIVRELQGDIIHNRIRHGEVVNEDHVRVRYGVDAPVARDIIGQLVTQHFLKFEHEHGGNIAIFHYYEAINLTEQRGLGECLALRFSMRTIQPKDFAVCHRLLNRFEDAGSIEDRILFHKQFFSVLYGAWGRETIEDGTQTYIARYAKYLRLFWLDKNRLAKYQQELRGILQLCEQGDVDQACTELWKQIRDVEKFLIDELRTVERGMMSEVGLFST